MYMYIFMFVCALLVPIAMIALGNHYKKNAPKKIQKFSGYRTTMSMQNQDTWEYAHSYVGKLWLISGSALLIITIAMMVTIKNNSNFEMQSTYLVFAQLAVMIITILPVEIKLRKVFHKNGIRK